MRRSPARSPGPIVYPWPQRAPGLIETAFDELAKRWKPILDAFDDAGVRRRLRDPSRRGHVRRRDLRALPRRVGRPHALQHPLRSRRTSCCSSSTISPTSTSTTSGSRRFTSRTPSSTRPAARASIPAMRPGSSAPGASVRSATGRSISAASSPRSRSTAIRRWAVLEWECCLKHPRGRRARRRRVHQASHHPRHRQGVRRFRRRRGRQEADQARARAATEGRDTMAIEGRSDAGKGRQDPARHGGRRARAPSSARFTASPRASTTSTSSSPARCRRRRRRRAAPGEALGLAADRIYDDYESMAKAEASAPGRDRGGRDRHAEPHARRAGSRVPRGGRPRHLRQAADGLARGSARK